MSWVAVAIGGSALLGAGASIYAGNRQADAGRQALAFQQQAYNKTQNDLAPYRMAGTDALNRMTNFTSGNPSAGWQDFIKSPDYNFRLSEGTNALENSVAARGGLLSGNALRGITQYGQNFASGEFGNYWNRLFQQSQMGANAAAGSGQLGTQAAGQIGNTIGGIGQAQASGAVGAANAVTGAVGSGINAYTLNNYLNRSSFANGSGSQMGWAPNPNGGGTSPMFG